MLVCECLELTIHDLLRMRIVVVPMLISDDCYYIVLDLANMYMLLKPIKSVGPLCQCLELHIRKTGLQMIESLTQDNVRKKQSAYFIR